jgi:hypothetical protein
VGLDGWLHVRLGRALGEALMVGPICGYLGGMVFAMAGLFLDFSIGQWCLMMGCILWSISLVEHR